ncbi:MAG TPA: RidA family protein [Steroidobacteraceae bacterium]|nr:RidA family protein [Steroidobacteraceae bacterium]
MIERLHSGPRMSQAVIHGDTVYLAGQVATDPATDVAGQTRQVLATIDALLAEAGTDKTRIVSANIYLADIGTFAQMNAVWDSWVPAGHTPARATVEARLASPVYKVEIQVVAAR